MHILIDLIIPLLLVNHYITEKMFWVCCHIASMYTVRIAAGLDTILNAGIEKHNLCHGVTQNFYVKLI